MNNEEVENLKQVRDILVEKLNFFRKELAITADVSTKFELQKRIDEAEKDVNAINLQENTEATLVQAKKRLEELQEEVRKLKINLENNLGIVSKYTDYDDFIIDVKHFTHNQKATTSLPLAGKTVETLDKNSLDKLFSLELVKRHFLLHNLQTNDLNHRLKVLNLITNGLVLKGTFLCLSNIEQIRSVSQNAYISKFFVFEDNEGLRTFINEFVQGNLIEQFEQMIRHIKNNLYIIRDIETRTGDYQIPEKVFTELVANAFIHRSYEENVLNPTKVEIYPNRMEITNAGNFPDSIQIEDLQNSQYTDTSFIINPEVVQVFFLHEFVETAGKGIKRSQAILENKKMKKAIFEQKIGYVKTTIYKNKPKDSNEYQLSEIYALIDENRFIDVFEWLDNQNINSSSIQQLKSEFINGITDTNFSNRLKLLVKEIIKSKN
ncbi:ATP-binding protein [Bernardetia sp. OM2101]|uniref:ATP-binding protein n=1 Tax=Bernardetia sp. OM2101 TaxID=3344876 RepID=UPI0035CF6E1F